MSVRLDRPFRAAVLGARMRLPERDRPFFDLLCSAGQLCYRLPHDDINVGYVSGGRDPRRRLAREFSGMRRERRGARGPESWIRVGSRVARFLRNELDEISGDRQRRPLRVLLAYTPGALAPDCSVPRDALMGAAWKSVVGLFDGLFPSGIRAVDMRSCVSRRRLARLQQESQAGVREGRRASGVRAGPEGRSFAVDPRLMTAVGKALGEKVSPGFQARYLFYTRAGDHFWPHPDDPQYALQLLLCVDHRLPPGASSGSAFLGYGRDGSVNRYELEPGGALAVSPGLVHGREPMRPGERLVMLSIGLQLARSTRRRPVQS
jgi:hypothetical protein